MNTIFRPAPQPQPDAPFYRPLGNECTLFESAWVRQLPLLLKGPTGCGKTRFVSHMAAKLGLPLSTVSCHDDLAAADLTGRYLLKGGETMWMDGPLTRSVRQGGICYLDEIVEARTGLAGADLFFADDKPENIAYIDTPAAIREQYQYFTQATVARLRRAGYAAPFTSLEDGVADYVQNYLATNDWYR